MNNWLAIDGSESSPLKRQMARAFRGCRCAALLLILTLLLLIGGTLLTIFPAEHHNYNRLDNQTPLQTMGLVFLILGCVCAAAEVVLVVITIVFLRSVKTFNRNEMINTNESDLFGPSLTIHNINNFNNNNNFTDNRNDYKNLDFSAIQYSSNPLITKQSLSSIKDSPKECELLNINV